MTELLHSRSEPILAFGPFKLLPQRKMLFELDHRRAIGSRALDILTLLVERSGAIVSKDELLTRVWPDTHVEETNLRVNIAALRKILGEGADEINYITNVPGRGYCFSAPVMRINGAGTQAEAPAAPPPNLPGQLTRMIGRDEVIAALRQQIDKFRLVTIVGPGGMGKTTVALATARGLAGQYAHGVRFVDLAPLTDAALVPIATASALGLSIASDHPLPGLLAYLREKSMLIILDNCEHVIDAAAALAEAVLRGAPHVHVLATSREPMRAEGEWIHRLAPLQSPEFSEEVSAANAMNFPAMCLFAERAAASGDKFDLSDENAPAVADLCRRLDGLPLAIELAAARVNMFGVRLLAEKLDDRLLLLSEGRRTALPRHQTLHATLDWSYDLLTAAEQAILRAVSIFKSAFSVESALAVAQMPGLGADAITDGLESLAAKSLLTIDTSGPAVKCRLLDSTRAYAGAKLRDAGDLPALSRRHAERHVQLLTRAEADWDEMNAADWPAVYGPMIDDIRAALRWCLSPEGDVTFAAILTAAAIPLWMHLSLTNECGESVARVIERTQGCAPATPEAIYRRMKLLNALGLSLLYTKGPGPQIENALNGAFALAEQLGDVDYQLRAVWGLFVATFNEGNYAIALERAERFRKIAKASDNVSDSKAGDRLLGFALHLLGRQNEARVHIEGMLKSYVVPTRRSDFVRFQYDQRVAARVPLSAILWLQGHADQAMDNARRAVEEAQSINHAISLGYALSTAACPTAFLAGDLAAAQHFVAMLADHSAAHGLGPWSAWGRYFKSMLVARQGQLGAGLRGIAAALEELRSTGFVLRYTFYLAEYADLLGQAGRLEQGHAAIDEALARCKDFGEGWCLPELLRIKGDLLLRDAASGPAARAEELFLTSLNHAKSHGTPAWELRTANSLARHYLARHRHAAAGTLLSATYAKFTEGSASRDLIEARNLLETMNIQ